MQTLLQGLRYGAQMLLRKLGFTLSAIITLALGIGANTAAFSLANAASRSLPHYAQPEQQVKMGARQKAPDFVKPDNRDSAHSESESAPALAGYIVQRVAGQPFEKYVAEHIFKPLGMPHSTFVQPLPETLKPMMSRGYGLASEPAGEFTLVPGSPSGGLSITAADMARFMLAHLQDGSLDEASILRPETAQMMHSRQFGILPSMNGMARGFVEGRYNDYRLIGHGGGIRSFISQLYLVPRLRLGFFISQNSSGRGGPLHNVIWPAFFDRYFPLAPTNVVETVHSTADIRALSGFYKAPSGRWLFSMIWYAVGLTANAGGLARFMRLPSASPASALSGSR